MGREGEEQRLLASSIGVSPHHFGTDITEQRQLFSGRGFLLILFVAFGIFGVSTGSARYLFPRGIRSRQPIGEEAGLAVQDGSLRDDDGPTTTSCTSDVSKPVMEGVDLVAYFSLEPEGLAVYGTEAYTASYNGYNFWFESEENMALFEEEPLRYIPAWGGFCSWGIAREDWWTIETLGPQADPNSWLITDDGVLHFFHSSLPKNKFMGKVPGVWGNIQGNIRAGNDLWTSWWGDSEPGVLGSPLNTACFCSVETCIDA